MKADPNRDEPARRDRHERSREEQADHDRDERSREEQADHDRDERSREEPARRGAARAKRGAEIGIDPSLRAVETGIRTGRVKIGTSGWLYPPWRKVFYPPGLPHKQELAYLSSKLNSVEINGTFYSLQRPTSFAHWYTETPADFTFAVKGPRFVTHMKKLAGVETPLANFFASGVLALRDKLGPVLWQLPPTLGFDADRLAAFFALLPRSTQEAAWLARRHDERLSGRAIVSTDLDRPLRHALEVRHHSFVTPAFTELLREHAIALVIADTAGRWPLIREVTTDFVYVRLHGDVELYTSGYTEDGLNAWAAAIRDWLAADLDVQVHFDNDVKVHAPYDAINLARKVAG